MTDFDLGRRFDAVLCLFSSIGYARTRERLGSAGAALAAHVAPGGVHALFADEEELKIVRMNTSTPAVDNVTTLEFHYLVGRTTGVEYFTEQHELGVFSHDDYVSAFEDAGLEVEHDPEGLMGRGLYIGRGS